MDFNEEIEAIGARIKKTQELIKTEEATKQAFIIPFIKALNYDVYDPSEVVPEYTADHGTKKNEKVDYAIVKDGQPIMLFECKRCSDSLDNSHASQLFRYFSVTDARVAVLTNGIIYRFYTDLDKSNQMDIKPFLEINLLDLQENLLAELRKFAKEKFNLDELIPTAIELKYTREIRQILGQQLADPQEEFVRFFASQVFPGPLRKNVIEQFTGITKRAFNQFIKDEISKRFDSVMNKTEETEVDEAEQPRELLDGQSPKQKDDPRIVTTDDELAGFKIVRDIVSEIVEPERVFFKDNTQYFAILLDDNNRRPVCRLHFDRDPKQIELVDQEHSEKVELLEIENIKFYANRLKETVLAYIED